jgi:hypothetical protein
MKTPTGTCARVEPSFDGTSAATFVVADEVVELETIELVLELADFQTVGVHILLVAIPRLVDLVDGQCGFVVD